MLLLDIGAHGDCSTKLFGGYKCCYDSQWSLTSRHFKHCALIQLENCRHALDNNLFIGPVLMVLSKVFDCILHNLLIAKPHPYGLDFDTVTFLHNYLKHWKQSVKSNNISSFFQSYTFWCITRFNTGSNSLQHFYKWLVLMANKIWFT